LIHSGHYARIGSHNFRRFLWGGLSYPSFRPLAALFRSVRDGPVLRPCFSSMSLRPPARSAFLCLSHHPFKADPIAVLTLFPRPTSSARFPFIAAVSPSVLAFWSREAGIAYHFFCIRSFRRLWPTCDPWWYFPEVRDPFSFSFHVQFRRDSSRIPPYKLLLDFGSAVPDPPGMHTSSRICDYPFNTPFLNRLHHVPFCLPGHPQKVVVFFSDFSNFLPQIVWRL